MAARQNDRAVQLPVLVHTPAHSGIAGPLTYRCDTQLPPGTLVRVPLGRREVLGIVWDAPPEETAKAPPAESALKPIAAVLDAIAPLPAGWRRLIDFTASYYQRSAGEVALAALPPALRELNAQQLARRAERIGEPASVEIDAASQSIALNDQQQGALGHFEAENGPFLLFGATGSGKTEVYLRAVQRTLEQDESAQALVLVPEINLTPQLEAQFGRRFGAQAVVSLHSGMTNPQRLKSWLAAHAGVARIVLGTRMAVFASLPRLKLIAVDEEQDPSYKSQEGARYSARDLAVYRGHIEHAKVLLGSATPSLESWLNSRPARAGESAGRYLRLDMPRRIGESALPEVRLVPMGQQPKNALLAPPLVQAIQARIARGEQSMLLLNRRGYAPVLHCADCDWKSECPHCSAYRVFHKIDRSLRCHHCGFGQRVPRGCPSCGNPDIAPIGRGTERLEEHLGELLAGVTRPDGAPVRIRRIDADSTRGKGALEQRLAEVHSGEVDVLVGTQMIAKGHDFRRITLVGAVNPDGALFSSDFRAAERLFSLLMQAAGRAGRDAAQGAGSEMWVQTFHPGHALYAALREHDFEAFARSQLGERERAGMPPFSSQALLRAEARSQQAAQDFLNAAGDAAAALPSAAGVNRFAAVPMAVQKVANVERAQLLVESGSRRALQRFLSDWQPLLHALRAQPAHRPLIRWALDVDPLSI